MTDKEPDSNEATETSSDEDFEGGYLKWQCGKCGETGKLKDGIPEKCPNCGALEEDIEEGPTTDEGYSY